MAVLLQAQVDCAECRTTHPAEIEFMWGEDNAWHCYGMGDNIKWKSGWRKRVVPALGLRLVDMNPVWIHGVDAGPTADHKDYLITILGNRIRDVRALPAVPPRLYGFGLAGWQQDLFCCSARGPSLAWPEPLDACDEQWLRTTTRAICNEETR